MHMPSVQTESQYFVYHKVCSSDTLTRDCKVVHAANFQTHALRQGLLLEDAQGVISFLSDQAHVTLVWGQRARKEVMCGCAHAPF